MNYNLPANLNQPAKDVLLDFIYDANGIRFNEWEITFGLPQALDQRPDLDWDPNTYINAYVPQRIDARYEGHTGFMYRRIPLSELEPLVAGPIAVPPFPFKTWDILDILGAYYGTQFTLTDLQNDTFTDETLPITLSALPTALLWIGTSAISEHTLNALAPEPELEGFKEYGPSVPSAVV